MGPYECAVFRMWLANFKLSLLYGISLICSLNLVLNVRPVCLIYILSHILHFNIYIYIYIYPGLPVCVWMWLVFICHMISSGITCAVCYFYTCVFEWFSHVSHFFVHVCEYCAFLSVCINVLGHIVRKAFIISEV
jgi:hypothetical protein